MKLLKNSIKLTLIASLMASALTAHAKDDENGVVLSGGSSFITSAVMCAYGNVGACAAAAATSVIWGVAITAEAADKEMIFMAKDSARSYLLGEEMQPVLEEAILVVREVAAAQQNDAVMNLSDNEIAAGISIL